MSSAVINILIYIIMKVIFYSDKCEYSIKILAYLNKYNIENMFKLVNISTSEIQKK